MHRQFAERLNKELDGIGVPPRTDERIEVFAKLVKIPKFKAEAFLDGITLPDPAILNLIAQELEVDPDWLIGKSDHRQKKRAPKSSLLFMVYCQDYNSFQLSSLSAKSCKLSQSSNKAK